MSEQSTLAQTPEQEQVEYRDVPGNPGYRVGSDGSVWSKRHRFGLLSRWKPLKPCPFGLYWKIGLYRGRGAKPRHTPVHVLILEAFVGPCPDGMESCHNDGDGRNNRLDNLRWDTPKANAADRISHGKQSRGESQPLAKLTGEKVKDIRRIYAAGETSKQELADKYGVCRRVISSCISRTRWRHINDD